MEQKKPTEDHQGSNDDKPMTPGAIFDAFDSVKQAAPKTRAKYAKMALGRSFMGDLPMGSFANPFATACNVHLAVQIAWANGETIDLRTPADATDWDSDMICSYLTDQLKSQLELIKLKLKQKAEQAAAFEVELKKKVAEAEAAIKAEDDAEAAKLKKG